MLRAGSIGGSKNGGGAAARTPLPNGRTPLPNGRTPLPNGRTPLPNGRTPLPNGRTPLPNGRPSSSLSLSRDTSIGEEASQSSSTRETAQSAQSARSARSATRLSSHSKPRTVFPAPTYESASARYGPYAGNRSTPQLRDPRQPPPPNSIQLSRLPGPNFIYISDSDDSVSDSVIEAVTTLQPPPPNSIQLSRLPGPDFIYISDSDDSVTDSVIEAVTTLQPRGPPARLEMPPPLPSQKGTGKKGRDRQSRSRNTTPSIMSQSDPEETAYLRMPLQNFQTDEGIDNYGSGKEKDIPTSKELEAVLDRLGKLVTIADARGTVADRGMRTTVGLRKERLEEIETERRDDEQKERLKKEALDEEERGRNKKASKMKKRKDASTAREERPLAHGAHGLAAQDGTHHPERSSPLHDKKAARKASRERDNDSASSSLSPVAVATPTATGMDIDKDDDDDSSSDEHQPPPAPAIPHLQTFGDDPNTFPDPTLYEIRPVRPGMTIAEMNELYSVAGFPEDDLEEFIPGTPPDKDFSNAKPTNQVQFNTFATYLEPYFRPFTEEDLAFLRERGDRVTPFIIPRRGKKHYTEVWAEEDGALSVDGPQGRDKLPANQARGDIENMTDAIAETDQISAGPILSRLLATMRPEHRAPAEEKNNGVNGDVDMNADLNADLFGDAVQPPNDTPSVPPATFMPDSNSEAWKKATHPKLDHAQVDERIKQELRHIGFLPPDTEPDYDAHYDDENAARLRHLQARLKQRCIMNGAMKARLTDLTKERMAYQEFSTIREDLDSQVQSAYLKRTRTMGKNKKNKKPGGAGGGSHVVAGGSNGMARPAIGDVTKTVMERRKKWVDTIGCVLDKDANEVRRNRDPDSSIFKPEDMAEYIRKEKESWDEEVEEE